MVSLCTDKQFVLHDRYALFLFAAALHAAGCFGDDPLDGECELSPIGCVNSAAAHGDTGDDFVLELPDGPKMTYATDYEGFYEADDSYGPQGEPVILDSDHTGWEMARCYDCHAEGKPHEFDGHDPRMQYWAWSCAKGFPGGTCHGHGVNGTPLFNHERDTAFLDCTQSLCHDTFNAPKERENHGMFEADDEYCHACHDFYWEAWPEEVAE